MQSDIHKIILASKSPRRIELIQRLGLPFEVKAIDVDETFNDDFSIQDNIVRVAYKKANAVKDIMSINDNEVIIGCDTVVCINDKVLTKPKDKDDAFNTLKLLSATYHNVISGVCLLTKNKTITFTQSTKVEFSDMSDDEINYYINTGEVFDKAGSYAIQGNGSLFIKSIDGDYYNVMGLPLSKLYQMFKEIFGYTLK